MDGEEGWTLKAGCWTQGDGVMVGKLKMHSGD